MVRKLSLKLPEIQDLYMDEQDLKFIRYYTSLQCCSAIEVSGLDFVRITVILDYFEFSRMGESKALVVIMLYH